MVAYSFQHQFVIPIQVGLGFVESIPGTEYYPKRHTIRADRKRHARTGEELQLYRGMRTKSCYLIGRARCTSIQPIELRFTKHPARQDRVKIGTDKPTLIMASGPLNKFARSDGFNDWDDLREFWQDEHGERHVWRGVIIYWEPL